MTNFSTLRSAHETSFTNRVGWEIVMQHERIFPGSFEIFDNLRITQRSQCSDDQGLSLAASEQCRAVCLRQHPDFYFDRTNRLGITAVYSRRSIENAITHGGFLQLGKHIFHITFTDTGFFVDQLLNRLHLKFTDRVVTLHLFRDLIGFGNRRCKFFSDRRT